MINEFGARLGRNGYADSILQRGRTSILSGECLGPDRCYLCSRGEGLGVMERLERHEPWGAANRTKSKNLGMWVLLHRRCHEQAHREAETGRQLRKDAQRAAMLRYHWTREEFIRRFGRSELSEAEAGRLLQPERGSAAGNGPEGRDGGFRVLREAALPF